MTPNPDSQKSIAIVVADFNDEITGRMLAQALEEAKKEGANVVKVVHAPGAFDIPLVAAELLGRGDVQAVVTLGAVIKGDTQHDDAVVQACTQALVRLSLHYKKPVSLGIIGPGATHAQASARSDEYARRAVRAALRLIDAAKEARE